MAKISFLTVLCILVMAVAGCGTKQETTNPTPAQTQPQSGPAAVVPAETKDKSVKPRPVVFGRPLTKFEIIEKTINDVKASTYYVNEVAELYLRAFAEAVEKADGIEWVAAFLDTDRPVYEAEKKYIEGCFARGIKMSLTKFGLFESPAKGHIVEEERDHHLYEHKVHVKYAVEITYADGSKETQQMRKVFTMLQRQVFGRKDCGDDFVQKISVVITDIKDAGIATANVAPLNDVDYALTYVPTGDTIQILKSLTFNPDNVKVDKEKDYVAGITVYGKDYATSRGVSVGDAAEKVKERYGEPSRPSVSKNHYKCVSYMEKSQVLKIHFYLDKESERVIAININVYPVGAPPMIKLDDGEYH
jgi:hypothetical protein